MRRISVKGQARDALRQDTKLRKSGELGTPLLHAPTADSFINLSQRLGMGADNALSQGTYGFNPVTRIRILLEWIHRGSWLGGIAVDAIADDMTRKGIEFTCEMPPEDSQQIEHAAESMGLWQRINETIKWSRLYGGAIGVMLIQGQDMRTPLNLETVGRGQFKGILPLDRWQVEPSLEDLVTDFGPHLGLPKYYRVQDNAPALRGLAIHHSRVAFRLEGIKLPYNQRLMENLWGISVLERLYDRMVAFDSASTGAAQLVFKSYLRTLKVDGFRELAAAGGDMMLGFASYMEMMRRYQGIEGITVIDTKDDFEVQTSTAMSGMSDVILQIGQQLSGALEMPLVRMFGQSPAGLNSTGESDIRTYYDGINKRQRNDIGEGVTTCHKLIAQSEGVKIPDDFGVAFRSLWDMDDKEKADVADTASKPIFQAKEAGIIGTQTALKELRQMSRRTGIFTNITQEQIDAADDEIAPPMSEQLLGDAGFGDPDAGKKGLPGVTIGGKEPDAKDGNKDLPGDEDGATGSDGKAKPVAARTRRRVEL